MNVTGSNLILAVENLVVDLQNAATEKRNVSFAGAAQSFLEPHGIDPLERKLRLLMTRIRGDSDEDLANNKDILLATYPDLQRIGQPGLEDLTKALSKEARSANRLASIERVNLSIVKSVIRPMFFAYPLEKLARETGFVILFDQQSARKKSEELRARKISLEGFEDWTRDVFELFQESSVMPQTSSRNLTGTKMPGVVNSLNLRRYTNVWFDFTAKHQAQILADAQNPELINNSEDFALDRSVSQARPKYSSAGSSFAYKTLTTPTTKISILISGLADSSVRATKDWVSKESFETEILAWTLGVLEILGLSNNEFCLEVKVRTGSTQTGIEVKNRDAATACKDALRFLSMSLSI